MRQCSNKVQKSFHVNQKIFNEENLSLVTDIFQ